MGGKVFAIGIECLVKSQYFFNMFSHLPYDGSTIFVDRSPHIFKHILSALRDRTYPYPKKYVAELDYFLVNLSDVKIHDPEPARLEAIRRFVSIEVSSPCFSGMNRESCTSYTAPACNSWARECSCSSSD